MKRLAAIVMVVAVVLSSFGLAVLAEKASFEVKATYQEGKLNVSWNADEVPEGYTLDHILLQGQKYRVTPAGHSAELDVFLVETTKGTCVFQSAGNENLTSEFSATVDLTLHGEWDDTTATLTVSGTSRQYENIPLKSVRIDGEEYLVKSLGDNRFEVDLSELPAGEYSYHYVLWNGTVSAELKGSRLVRAGGESAQKTTLTARKTGTGTFEATLLTEDKQPVSGATVTLTAGDYTTEAITDEEGKAVLFDTADTEILTRVTFRFEGGIVGGTAYDASSYTLKLSNASSTTSTTSRTSRTSLTTQVNNTTATSRTSASTAASQIRMGATTTAIQDSLVVVNALYDVSIIKPFGVKEDEFTSRARLLLPKDAYAQLAPGGEALLLSVLPSDKTLADSVLEQAIENSDDYAFYEVGDARTFSLSLGVVMVDAQGEYSEIDTAMLPEGTYTVQLPVPAAFRKCDLAVISLEDDRPALVEALLSNGSLEFDVNRFGAYAVVAFPSATKTLLVPAAAIWLFVLAGIFLAAAVVILIVFVIRRPKTALPGVSGEAMTLLEDGEEAEDTDRLTGDETEE